MKNKVAKKILKMEKDKLMSRPEPNRDWELITALDVAIEALAYLDEDDVLAIRIVDDTESEDGTDNL